MTIPDTLQYTKGHEWIQIQNGEATIGIPITPRVN